MVELDKIIKKIDGLRPASSISSKIIEITSNPDSSMSELVDIITYDQAITANLLRICNSTYFGLTREITSIRTRSYLPGDKQDSQFSAYGDYD